MTRVYVPAVFVKGAMRHYKDSSCLYPTIKEAMR